MRGVSRRTFLALTAALALGPRPGQRLGRGTGPSDQFPSDPFTLGVASGDPDRSSVVLWTRLTGMGLPPAVEIEWEVATDEAFTDIVATGRTATDSDVGHSVHLTVEIDGPVHYRFRAGGFTSPIGRTAPVPARATELRIASASCQHYETGYYAAHRDIAEWAPDLVAFLGDFIYEGAARPIGEDRVRTHEGPEPIDVAGYRARYATYLSDPHLRASRAVCPWLVIWDDHEVENNYAALFPQDEVDGPTFADRRQQAYQAWWEHHPVRLPAPAQGEPYPVYRRVTWGGLADLIALDGRQFRSDQACPELGTLSLEPPCPEAAAPERTMLGEEQEAWLGQALRRSRATWPTIVQQTVMTDLQFNGAILNYDQWDGYAPARQRLLDQAAQVDRLVVLTGDIHLAGVGVLPGVGVEFVTTSVSSSGDVPADLQPVLDTFEDVVASELVHRGYTRHTVTPTTWTAEYRIVEDAANPDSVLSTWQTFTVDAAARDQVSVGALPAGG